MAPKRRTATARKASGPTRQQSTLSFSGKGVSKPGALRDTKSSKKDPALFEDVVRTDEAAEADRDLSELSTADGTIQQETEVEVAELKAVQDPLNENASTRVEDVLGGKAEQSDLGAVGGTGSGWVGDEENKARKTTDTQIKRYWREKEQKRLAPRVHQEDMTVFEKVLREWDMSGQYGPCIGIARLKRWKRANTLGLNPPIEVLAVLLKQMDAGNEKVQRAHVDELMSSRFVET